LIDSPAMRRTGKVDDAIREVGVGEVYARMEHEKSLLKSIYLLQLRKPFFTKDEFAQQTDQDSSGVDDTLRQFTASGILECKNGEEYSLQDRGRLKLRIVLAGGVYDILHLGHLAVLAEAKTYGDVLVVVVATDVTVEMSKGRRPVFPEEDRRALVEALKPVDAAILGYEDVGMGFEQVIDDVKPKVIALGYDQDSVARMVAQLVERKKLNIEVVRLAKFDKEKYLSSSAIRQRFFREPN
jgi:cytidyltransferase-like protein